MAVLVEGISVVVRIDSIEAKFHGGYGAFVETVPNSTCCTDGELARVGFLNPDDTGSYIDVLKAKGLAFVRDDQPVDIAVVDQQHGSTVPCDWLEFARLPIGEEGDEVSACWLFDEPRDAGWGIYMKGESMNLATPAGWQFEGSLSHKFKFVPLDGTGARQHASPGLAGAWDAAGMHLQTQGGEEVIWICTTLDPPDNEYLVFLFGNQLFFVFVQAAEFIFASHKERFLRASEEANATPCVLRMVERESSYEPATSGWGLVHALTGKPIDPPAMISNELIKISDWELHDFAIQVVRDQLAEEGGKILSWQSSLHKDPSAWIEMNGEVCWVVVRAVRYPEQDADLPEDILDIRSDPDQGGKPGYFASVAVANAEDAGDDSFESLGDQITPIYRRQAMVYRYEGLKPI